MQSKEAEAMLLNVSVDPKLFGYAPIFSIAHCLWFAPQRADGDTRKQSPAKASGCCIGGFWLQHTIEKQALPK